MCPPRALAQNVFVNMENIGDFLQQVYAELTLTETLFANGK